MDVQLKENPRYKNANHYIPNESVSVVGLGRLGMPLAAALTERGFHVIGVDCNPEVVHAVKRMEPTFHEPGMLESLTFEATADLRRAVLDTDTTIVLVATPSDDDGRFSLEYVLEACREIGGALQEKPNYHNVIISSTVMPGSMDGPIIDAIEEGMGERGKRADAFGLCYIPEFGALGQLMGGFINPDFVLVGALDEKSAWGARAFYRQLCPNMPPIVVTNFVNAEIAKIALNTFLTTKISFANQIGWICEGVPGANADDVLAVLGLDSRISHKFLKAATAYGGPCFPRDDQALKALARQVGALPGLVDAVSRDNKVHLARLVQMVHRELEARGKRATVGILGLAFKPGVDSTVASVGVALMDALFDYPPLVYDPLVHWHGISTDTPQQLADLAHVVVCTTADGLWRGVQFHAGQTVIDCWRVLDREAVEGAGAKYMALGVGALDGSGGA